MTNKIEFKELTMAYKKNKALNHFSLNLEEKKIYGLLGRNGAGKTTLFNLLTNKLFPTHGEILIHSENVIGNENILSKIYYMSEKSPYPVNMKVKDIYKWTHIFYPNFDMSYALHLSKKFGLDIKKKYKNLSTGYASILKIITTLSSNADILLFDEPVLGLDAHHRDIFYKELIAHYTDHPKTIIISTHLIDEVVDVIEEVIIINEGELVLNDSTENILKNGYTLSGKSTDVDTYIQNKNVIGTEKIGPFKSAYILGPVPSKNDIDLTKLNLDVSKLDLQKLFIQLTQS